jgi:lipid-A-disaccharide synthase-like uncharacterized protein
MDSHWHLLGAADHFLGLDWDFWKYLGWLGNAVFFSRFMVQWYFTEKRRQVVVPAAFWWLSLAGSMLLFIYGLHTRDSVFIFAYAITWIPNIRNLIIQRRHAEAHLDCASCGKRCPPQSNFCHSCGERLTARNEKVSP